MWVRHTPKIATRTLSRDLRVEINNQESLQHVADLDVNVEPRNRKMSQALSFSCYIILGFMFEHLSTLK